MKKKKKRKRKEKKEGGGGGKRERASNLFQHGQYYFFAINYKKKSVSPEYPPSGNPRAIFIALRAYLAGSGSGSCIVGRQWSTFRQQKQTNLSRGQTVAHKHSTVISFYTFLYDALRLWVVGCVCDGIGAGRYR